MTTQAPLLFGPMRDHPAAIGLSREVVRVHRRFATEIVAARRLCPFVRDVDVAFGQFCVAMTLRPDLGEARDAFLRAENPIIHMVYPLVRGAAPEFERFGAEVGRVARELWRSMPSGSSRSFGAEPPVIASFHPDLPGERRAPHRLIGLLRHSPDPFVQIIPGGHHEGGTTVASITDVEKLTPEVVAQIIAAVPVPQKDHIHDTFARLTGSDLDAIAAKSAEILVDRNRSYAPFLKELGVTVL